MYFFRATRFIGFPLLLAALLFTTGCNKGDVGETVPSPPRALVEKSFHPPVAGGKPGDAPGVPPESSQNGATKNGK